MPPTNHARVVNATFLHLYIKTVCNSYPVLCFCEAGLDEFAAVETENATNNFPTIVVKGGFGTVYKMTYHHLPIAVRV